MKLSPAEIDAMLAKGATLGPAMTMPAIVRAEIRVLAVFPIVIDCPGLLVVSEANQRCHWAERRKRMNTQKDGLLLAIVLGRHVKPILPDLVRITFTRIGGRKLDSDNLAGAFKGVRDSLCGWLGIDDGSDRLTFDYRQEKGLAGIRCTITELEG